MYQLDDHGAPGRLGIDSTHVIRWPIAAYEAMVITDDLTLPGTASSASTILNVGVYRRQYAKRLL